MSFAVDPGSFVQSGSWRRTDSRFGIDKWRYSEPGNLTQLERWPDNGQGEAIWRVLVAYLVDGEVRLTQATADPALSDAQARLWAESVRALSVEGVA